MAAPEGYLFKKPQNNFSWLKRYYAWDTQKNALAYWKGMKECHAKQTPKGTYLATDLLNVWQPDKSDLRKFNVEFRHKLLTLRAETAKEGQAWVAWLASARESRGGHDNKVQDTDEDAANWDEERILQMMAGGQVMTAYFQNNTKKFFVLFCKDSILYACPMNQGIEKAIISFPLKHISDIYVGKQTPGFDTDIAFSTPFDNCFSIISPKYTLDIAAKSTIMATHWLTGIKTLLTRAGKGVITTEEGAEEEEEPEEEHHVQQEAPAPEPVQQQQPAPVQQPVAQPEPTPAPEEVAEPAPEPRIRKTALLIVDMTDSVAKASPPLPTTGAVVSVVNGLRNRCVWDLIVRIHAAGDKDVDGLEVAEDDEVVTKGADAHSAFQEKDMKTPTKLLDLLVENAIDDIFVTGLRLANAVGTTAIDGTSNKFHVFVVEDACASANEENTKKMMKKFKSKGVPVVKSSVIPDDSLMPDAITNEARDNMELNEEEDSGDDNDTAPTPFTVTDFLSEDFMAVANSPAPDDEDAAPAAAAAAAAGDAAADAKKDAGAKKAAAKKGSAKKPASKKGSKKGSGVRIVEGTKKTASGKTVSTGTRSASKKAASKKGSKSAAGSKKAGAKKPASKKPASKKPAASPTKKGSKKAVTAKK